VSVQVFGEIGVSSRRKGDTVLLGENGTPCFFAKRKSTRCPLCAPQRHRAPILAFKFALADGCPTRREGHSTAPLRAWCKCRPGERSKAINISASLIALLALVCQRLSAADTAYLTAGAGWCPLDSSGKRWGWVARFDITSGDHKDDRLEPLGSSGSL
jgi:hypothetical protein